MRVSFSQAVNILIVVTNPQQPVAAGIVAESLEKARKWRQALAWLRTLQPEPEMAPQKARQGAEVRRLRHGRYPKSIGLI